MSLTLSAMFVENARRLANQKAIPEAMRSLYNAYHCRDLPAAHRVAILDLRVQLGREHPVEANRYLEGLKEIERQEVQLIAASRKGVLK